ncbi:MAG: RagB/SusD family nutrient uptake outer membrane protein [Mucilaginibacter sp.]|nr:RagB/SusD family nutrient uptake outer membrane protein [Mucilaginibacter sp.]
MKNPFHYKLILALLISALTFASCKKFVDAGSPKSELTTDKVFADSAGAAGAVNGLYINMIQPFGQGFSSGGITVAAGLVADELSTTAQGPNAEFFANNVNPRNAQNESLWTGAYQQLYPANSCIEGIAASGLTPSQKDRLTAEARVVRAYLLFNLVNLYGPVPLATMTDYRISRTLPRSPVNEVYQQIQADLQFAQAHLDQNNVQTQHANVWAATSLLARVYLYQGKYAQAAAEASKVIIPGNFNLEKEPKDVFLAGSRETIWRLIPVYPGRETWEASLFVPSSATATPPFVITDRLKNSFEFNDKRGMEWIGINTIAGKVYAYPDKYKRVFSSGGLQESYVLIRLAEIYLIRAEARLRTGDVNGAIEDLKMIQQRANADLYTGTASGLAAAIEQERRKELFCESGHRWFDLKRTGRANAVLTSTKPNWKETAQLLPIPQAQIDANPELTQNPGY